MDLPEMTEVERWVLTETVVRWVCGGANSPPVAYTAGYWSVGLPELVVLGMNMQQSTVILNTYGARQYEDKSGWEPGEIDRDLFNLPTKFGAVADDWIKKWLTLSFERHPTGGQTVQVLWPDRRGIFPDEPGYSTEFKGRQEILA